MTSQYRRLIAPCVQRKASLARDSVHRVRLLTQIHTFFERLLAAQFPTSLSGAQRLTCEFRNAPTILVATLSPTCHESRFYVSPSLSNERKPEKMLIPFFIPYHTAENRDQLPKISSRTHGMTRNIAGKQMKNCNVFHFGWVISRNEAALAEKVHWRVVHKVPNEDSGPLVLALVNLRRLDDLLLQRSRNPPVHHVT